MMSATKISAIVLIVGGVLALAYGRFSFTRHSETASMGPLSITMRERETVRVPEWVAIIAIVGGGLLLLTSKRGYRT